jgi:hypothetical protein
VANKAHLRLSIVEMSGESFERIGGYSKSRMTQQQQTTLIPTLQTTLFEN